MLKLFGEVNVCWSCCVCVCLIGDVMSDNRVSSDVEPHSGYTQGITVEQATLNGI